MDLSGWKEFFNTSGALIGMISALITALSAIAAYRLKKIEKASAAGVPVKLLSLKEQRSLNWNLLILKIFAWGTIIFFRCGSAS